MKSNLISYKWCSQNGMIKSDLLTTSLLHRIELETPFIFWTFLYFFEHIQKKNSSD